MDNDMKLEGIASTTPAVTEHGAGFDDSSPAISLTELDSRDMNRLGKRQELNRNFSMVPIIGFSVVLMATWEGQFTASTFGLINGGFAGIIWMYVVVFVGFVFIYATMSEMASMAPTSGGQYHWVSEFAPKSSQKFLSYITGWICVMGWQTGITSVAFLAGTQIQGLLVLNYPDYEFQRWHGTVLVIAVTSFAMIFNTFAASRLPVVEAIVLVLHILGFFAILIPLWVLAPRNTGLNDSTTVFTQFTNGGEWPTTGVACMVGMLSPIFTILGADAATHMSEEVRNASRVLPKSIMFSLSLNGIMGFIMLITFCFCFGPLTSDTSALGSPTGYPYIQVFASVTNSNGAASVMTAILIVLTVCGCISNVATASRQMYAFARDKGLPFSAFLSHVKPGWNIPLNAVLLSFLITTLLSLINIGSTTAFNAIASLGVASLISSYLISFSCLLLKRLRHEPLPPAQWSLGRHSIWVNAVSIAFLLSFYVFSFFPLTATVEPASMNWNVLIYGAAMVFAVSWYYGRGRRGYVGPVVYVRQVD